MKISALFLAPDGRLRASWRFGLFIPGFGLLAVGLLAPLGFLLGAPNPSDGIGAKFMVFGVAGAVAAALAAYFLLRWVDRQSFRTLGLWFYESWGRELGLGLAGGLVMLTVVVALLWALGLVAFRPGTLGVPGMLRGAVLYLLVFLPAAAFEELLFRGYPFQRLVEGPGPFFAVFLLSALFGLVHLRNPSATALSTTNTVLIGILLALAYLKTRALWLPLGVHLAWNFFLGFVYSLPVSGLVLPEKMFAVDISGPAWLSGGNYGPEGSVITTGVALTATVWLARTKRLGVSPAQARELG
ncbi:MAG: lysostaphin resistance A-like protein [Terriglobia bacterium]